MTQPNVPMPGPVNPPSPMGGWKMKMGSFLIAIAATIGGSAEVAPYPEMVPWIRFIAFIVGGVGAAFLAWGAGHKMEKNRPVLVKKQKIPYYIQKIDPDELKLLEDIRKQRSNGPEPPTA